MLPVGGHRDHGTARGGAPSCEGEAGRMERLVGALPWARRGEM